MTSWRDVLPIHPAADLSPMMSPEELRALGEDIKANGLKHPIVVWSETPDSSKVYLLDGRNRLDAMEAVGLEVLRADKGNRLEVPHRQLFGAGGGRSAFDGQRLNADPLTYVLSINVHRRHLTAEQRRDLIARVLKAKPEASNRQIAKQVKADDKTVGKVRKELEAIADIPQLEKTTGADGKARNVAPKRAKAPAKRNDPHSAERPRQIELEEAIAAKQSAAAAPIAATAQATLFEPDLEGGNSDEGLNASQLKTQNKRLRGKLRTLRKHIAELEGRIKEVRKDHEDTWRKLTLAQGDMCGAKLEDFVKVLCTAPNKVEILERTFWGLLEDEQEALIQKIGGRP